MLGSTRLRRYASLAAVVGVVVAATACEPPPEPSDHIEVTHLDIPGSRTRWSPRVMVNSQGEVVVSARSLRSDVVAYRWADGQSTRLGEFDTRARAMSERGHIVGDIRASEEASPRPFLWFEDEWTELPVGAGNVAAEASAVNDQGVVAGVTYGYSSSITAVLSGTPAVWRDGEILTPPTEDLPEGDVLVQGINNRNEVLISIMSPTGQDHHTVLWEVGGEVTYLGELGELDAPLNYDLTRGRGGRRINGRGMVLVPHGTSSVEGLRSAVWHDGEMTDLGTLGGDWTYATAINEWGQVVGVSTDEEGNVLPFLSYQGEMTQLEGLPGDVWPVDINNWGQVIGLAGPNLLFEPFLWQNGKFVNLGGLVQNVETWYLGERTVQNLLDINDRGQIVGVAYDSDYSDFPVMWEVSPTWGYYPDGLPTS